MSGTSEAQRVFDAGELSLGMPIDGLEAERDVQYAALAFKRATEYDPDMCDAWLGRAGDSGPEVIYHLYRTSKISLNLSNGGSAFLRGHSRNRGSSQTLEMNSQLSVTRYDCAHGLCKRTVIEL